MTNPLASLDATERRIIERTTAMARIPSSECDGRAPNYWAVTGHENEVCVIRVYRRPNGQEDAATVPEHRRFPDMESAVLKMRELNDALFGGAA